jgi:hypothetical protein
MCSDVPPAQACGNCGTQTRACDPNNGTWTGDWGACTNEGTCVPGTTRSCDGGAQTCGDNCQWLLCLKLVVTPIDPSIAAGRTQQFVVMGNYTGGGQTDLTSVAIWSSANPRVASFSTASGSAGVATGVSIGTTTVTASYGGTTGSATLNVTAAELVSISVTPVDPTIHVGGTKKFTATGTYTDGTTKDLTTSVSWTSNSFNVATINGQSGLATGVAGGTAVITASLGTVNGTTRLIVSNAPLTSIQVTPVNPSIARLTTLQFIALALYTDGTQVDVTSQVAWGSGNAAIASISNTAATAGLATGVGAGMATISAALNGITGSTTLNVTNAVLASIAITPSNPTIVSGASIAFTATGNFTDGTTQNVTTQASWSSTDVTVATVGTVTGVAVGTNSGIATINAAMQMVIGGTTLTVTP